jgi:hypothetical protein
MISEEDDMRNEDSTWFASLSDDSFEIVKSQTKEHFGENFFDRSENDLEIERLVERYVPNGGAKEERVYLLRQALKEDVIRRKRREP